MNCRNFSKIWFRSERFVWMTPPKGGETPQPAPVAPAGAPEAVPPTSAAPSAAPETQTADAARQAEEAAKTGSDAAKRLEQAGGTTPATSAAPDGKKPDTPPAVAEAATALAVAAEAAEEDSTSGGTLDKFIKVLEKLIDQITAAFDKMLGGKGKKEATESSLLGGATKLVIAKKYDEAKKEEGISITTTKDQQIFPPKGGIIEEITTDSMTIKTSVGEKITYKGITPNPDLKKGISLTAGGVVIGKALGETVTITAEKDGKFLDPTPLVSKYVQPEPTAAPAAAPTPVAEVKPADKNAGPKKADKKGEKAAAKPTESKEAAPAGQLTISGYIAGVGISMEATADTDIKLSQEVKVLRVDRNARILKLQLPTYTLQISDFNINPSLKKGATIKPGASLGKIIDKKAAKAVCTNDKTNADIDPTHFFTGKEQPKIQNPKLEITDYSPARGKNTIEIRLKQPDQKLQFGYGAWVEDVNREKGTLTLLVGGGYSVTFENINSSLDKSNQIKPFAEVGTPFDQTKPIIVSCTRELKKTDDKGVPLEKPKEEGGGFVYPTTFIDPTFFFKAPEQKSNS